MAARCNLFIGSILATICIGILGAPKLVAQASGLPAYQPTVQATGLIRVCGSPQMAESLRLYEEAFHQVQPSVSFVNDLQSTLTAVSCVYKRQGDIGLLGREIWPIEEKAFKDTTGHPPMVIDIATGSFDVPKATFALMIFVAKENPIASLSTDQLEAVFGESTATRRIRTWGDLGLTGSWASRPIHLYGFAVANDKSQIFSTLMFRHGEHWKRSIYEFSNAADGTDAGQLIVNAIASDPDAIGISNIHYATAAVKPLPISTDANSSPIAPTKANVRSRAYPLTRAVYIVLGNDLKGPPGVAIREFMRFVLSREGGSAVEKEGNYLPLPAPIAASQLLQLDRP